MTVLTCYQQPDTETQRETLAKRNCYRAGAGRVRRRFGGGRPTLDTQLDTHPEKFRKTASHHQRNPLRGHHLEQWAWEDSNLRPHAYQLCDAALPSASRRQKPHIH